MLLRSDEAAVRAAAAAAHEPNTWIKAFVAAGRGSAWLGPDWQYRGTEFVMTTTLTHPTLRVPDGYAVGAEETDGIIHVRARTVEGRALYESLGWTLLAPLAGFVHQP